jgi:hypothetical protein
MESRFCGTGNRDSRVGASGGSAACQPGRRAASAQVVIMRQSLQCPGPRPPAGPTASRTLSDRDSDGKYPLPYVGVKLSPLHNFTSLWLGS